MSKLAIVATIKTVPGKRDEYLAVLKAHGKRCLATEPGTLQFEILVPQEEADTIMLYEVYASPEAFQTHWNGASLQQAKQEGAGLQVSSNSVHCNQTHEEIRAVVADFKLLCFSEDVFQMLYKVCLRYGSILRLLSHNVLLEFRPANEALVARFLRLPWTEEDWGQENSTAMPRSTWGRRVAKRDFVVWSSASTLAPS